MSKRKKNNTSLRAQRLLSNTRLWSWEADLEEETRCLQGEIKRGITWAFLAPKDIVTIASNLNNWSLILRVIFWYPDNKADIKTVIGDFRNISLATLEAEAKVMRSEALKGMQERHIVDVGWLALSFMKTPRTQGDKDLLHLGAITPERQLLWRYAISEELKQGNSK